MIAYAPQHVSSPMPRGDILRPLVQAWYCKIQEGKRHKEPFDDIAKQCMGFFSGGASFMWKADFFKQYVGGAMTPMFKIGIQKAFELVALYGPTLYWRNPARIVKPRGKMQLDPALFGAMGDPQSQQYFQSLMQQQSMRSSVDNCVAQMMGTILNYLPGEQPGGGLAMHSSHSITEALVKGMGTLWPRPYFMPGSNRVLVGSFYKSCDTLLVDPDCEGPGIHGAMWVAEECIAPTWQVEREFHLPEGTLDGKGNLESSGRQGENWTDPDSMMNRRVGKTFDLITYYKIYSKGGVGARLAGQLRQSDELGKAFDQVVGDYAYIVIAPGVPYPLNCPTQVIKSATDTEVRKRFTWPIPYWLDDRWPVAPLKFYEKPNDIWPIAPLSPGLGELTFLNIMFSNLANQIWMNSRQIFVTPAQLCTEIEKAIKSGGEYAFVKSDRVMQNVKEMLGMIEFPDVKMDVWKIIDAVMQLFDKRVGLSELLYSLNPGGSASRTAEDAGNKKEMANIRPDYMAGRVEDWQTEVADMEKLCVRWFVEAKDLQGLFGPAEQFLYQRYVENESPEWIVRELRATVAANSVRKPDLKRDAQNLQQVLQLFFPAAMNYFSATRDPRSVNAMMQQWGQVNSQDVSAMLFQPPPPPPQPPPDPRALQAQQTMQLREQEYAQKMGIRNAEHTQEGQIRVAKARQEMLLASLKARQQMHHIQKVHAA